MYDFIDKLINVTMPRVRDFRGINRNHLILMEIILVVLKNIAFQR